jgi:glycosyltransferase involved in cell wall biosynthesis
MRVVELAASGHLGGAERVLLDSAAVRLAAGDDVSVLALASGPLGDHVVCRGGRFAACPPPPSLAELGDAGRSTAAAALGLARATVPALAYVRRFRRALADRRPEVVHSHGIKMHVLGALGSSGAPVIWHLHDYVGSRRLSSRLLNRLGGRVARAIAVSRSVADDARDALGPHVPIDVIYNAVDSDRFRPDGPVADLDDLAGLPAAPAGTCRIGLPATFARWKGHDAFFKALGTMSGSWRAYVIGGPVYATGTSQWTDAELRQMAAAAGLAGKVGFTGFVDDMPAVYRALDIVVHASTAPEPFGLVIAEALASGRALVSTTAGGAAELFVPGEHGLAAAPGDAASLATSLSHLIADAGLRTRLGDAGRRHAADSFGMQRFGRQLDETFRRATLSRADRRSDAR